MVVPNGPIAAPAGHRRISQRPIRHFGGHGGGGPGHRRVGDLAPDQLRHAGFRRCLDPSHRPRRLMAPHLMKDVYPEAQYVNGVPVNQVTEEKAA